MVSSFTNRMCFNIRWGMEKYDARKGESEEESGCIILTFDGEV